MQELIDHNILSFSKEKPNVKTNPFPIHNIFAVNVIEEEECDELVREVDRVKTLMTIALRKLQEHGFLKGLYDGCTVCETEPDEYVEIKSCMQDLINQGVIQFIKAKVSKEVSTIEPFTIIYRKKQVEVPIKKIQPINICVPGPFPYQSTKAVPWRYDTTDYAGGKVI